MTGAGRGAGLSPAQPRERVASTWPRCIAQLHAFPVHGKWHLERQMKNLPRSPEPSNKKRALPTATPSIQNPKMPYLPFLPPLSSFLPFFFMEAPCVALRITGAIAGFSSAKLEIYERAARLSSGIRAEIEKVLLRSRAGYLAGVIAVASLDGEALAFHPDLYVMNIR